jgi:AcrR family transcriptional regulator
LCENYFVVRNYHHGNLREELINGGVKLIAEKGVAGLTLREIGDRVGVSRTAPYRHFADKAALLNAISETAFTEFANVLQAARDGATGGVRSRLEAMGAAYIQFAEEHRAYYDVMFGERTAEGSEAGDRAFGILESTIREGQAAGEFRNGDPALLATTVWALSHGIAMLRLGPGFMSAGCEILYTGLLVKV